MKHSTILLPLFALAAALPACDDEGMDAGDMEIPEGYEMLDAIAVPEEPGEGV